MDDVFSFLSSSDKWDPDIPGYTDDELKEDLMDLTFNDIFDNFKLINDFMTELREVFKKEREKDGLNDH